MTISVRRASAADLPRAFSIWEAAVDAAYDFVEPGDRAAIARMVGRDHLPGADLWLAVDEAGDAHGFMALSKDEIESLFVDPASQGRGFGSALIAHALGLIPQVRVDTNEQAVQAVAFYEARGFLRIGRSPVDSMGMLYPLIHFRYPTKTSGWK